MHLFFALALVGGSAFAKAPKFDAASQALVGTYATVDGSYRMVLDRFSQPPRMQVAGTKDVVQLTLIERSGRSGGWDAYTPKGDWVFFMDKQGSLSRSKEQIPRVGDSKPLKKLTVKGDYVKPPSSYEVAFAELEPLSVQKKLGLKPQDSGDLAKVQEAMLAAPELVVHYLWSHDGGATYRPASPVIDMTDHGGGGYYPTDAVYDPSAAGPAGHGVVVQGEAWYDGRVRIVGTTPKGFNSDLATGTEGVIWSVDSATVVFVAKDGGRYTLSISGSELEKGGGHPFAKGASGKNPDSLQHTRLDGDDLGLLLKAGIVDPQVLDTLDEHNESFRSCAKKLFEGGKANLDKLAQENIEFSAKQARGKAQIEMLEAEVQTSCQAPVSAYSRVLLEQIEARNKARMALFEAVSK